MNVDWMIVATIAAPLLTLVAGAALNHFVEARPRIVTYLAHASVFRAHRPEGPVQINTHAVVLRNTGRRAATNVRLGHNLLPDFQVYPDVQYRVEDLPSGGRELVFPLVVPQKQITISYLYFPPVTWHQINTHFESDEGPARVITVLPQPQYPRWLINCLRVLVYIGSVTTLYLLFALVRWLYSYAT